MTLKKTIIPAHVEYNWSDIQVAICKKLGIKEERFWDMKNSHSHFNKWCKKKGYKDKDPDGIPKDSSQIWFAEYLSDPEGNAKRPPYRSLWHFALNNVIPDYMSNDSTVTMYRWDGDINKIDEWARPFLIAYNEIIDENDPTGEGMAVHFSW